jgi:probable F420-dependent oxidoreductase
MRFGVVVGAPTREDYVASVRRAESLGYDLVLCSDHLHLAGRHFSHFTPIPALTAAAMATERIRVGTAVINQDLRHPAVLARDAASLDVLSGGRLELGLGAGWNEPEYTMAGLSFDPTGVRVRRFAEYVHVVKGVMAEPAFSFAGEFFTVTEMPGEPPPLQRPHPPIMLGATGPRLLALAAREADIVSVNMLKSPDPSEAALAERIAWVREAAPDRFAALELQLPLAAVLPSPGTPLDAVRSAVDAGEPFLTMLASKFDLDVLADSPMVIGGPPAAMVDKLARLEEDHGVASVMIPMPYMEPLAPVIAELAAATA